MFLCVMCMYAQGSEAQSQQANEFALRAHTTFNQNK